MKKILKLKVMLLLIGAGMVSSSCRKWLDVQPQDKFVDNQIYSSELAASSALNGLYLQMASGSLYGQHLSMGAVDIMGQLYNTPSSNIYYNTSIYNYNDPGVQTTFTNVWKSAYAVIMNANVFLSNLTKYNGQNNIKPSSDSLMRGEAIAIRAMVHFDIVRLFGPVYATVDSNKTCVPYYTTASSAVSPLYPARAILDSVMQDLTYAESLMINDPVITLGSSTAMSGDPLTDIWRNRNQYLNYYAVKALQARVLLYRGNKADALTAAKVVINRADALFPWVNPVSILNDKDNPPRVMSTECLFALNNPGLYTNQSNLFASQILDANILAPNTTRLNATFENNTNDYRFNPIWLAAPTSNKSYKTFYKYADVVSSATSFRFLQSMIRKSEVYLIASECETDPNNALNYLNTYRFNRGLTALPTGTSIPTELRKEYQKEFYGEGQVFFYYKRLNIATIPNGSATAGNVTMSSAKYTVPLPLSETQYR